MKKPKNRNWLQKFAALSQFKKILSFMFIFAVIGSLLLKFSFAASVDTYYYFTTGVGHQTGVPVSIRFPENYPEYNGNGTWLATEPGPSAWFGPYTTRTVGAPSGISMGICWTVVMYSGAEYNVQYNFDVVSDNFPLWSATNTGGNWAFYMGAGTDGSSLRYTQGTIGGKPEAFPYAAGRLCHNVKMGTGTFRNLQFRAKIQSCNTGVLSSEKCRLYIKKVDAYYN